MIRRARGRYLRPSASDDYLFPGTLDDMLAVLERHPDKRVVFGDATVIDEHGRQTHDSVLFGFYRGRKANYATDAALRTEIIRRWSLAGPIQLIRLDLFEEIGGYDESLKAEDWDMMLRMVARNSVIYLDKPVAAYRVHGRNTFLTYSLIDPFENARETLTVLEKNHALFRGNARRRLDYMLFRQRTIVSCLEQGARPTRQQMRGIRRRALGQAILAQLKRTLCLAAGNGTSPRRTRNRLRHRASEKR